MTKDFDFMPHDQPRRHILMGMVLLAGGLVCQADFLLAGESPLPPAPALPELTTESRQQALQNLDADDYFLRQGASRWLQQGGTETTQALIEFVKISSPEGKVRALEAAQQIYLKLLRLQYDDEALQVRENIEQIRAADGALLDARQEAFQAIHSGLMIRSSVRAVVRLNAVLEFRNVKQTFPGISKQDFTGELPYHIFIGDNWLGNENDLRHVELLAMLGEQQFGSSRAIYRIDGCPIPLSTFEDLVAGIPGVLIEERSKARLGIGANNSLYDEEGSWKITQISPGTAAAHADLRLGDVIVRLDDHIVNTFRDLTKDLEAYAPPDQIVLDVLREDAAAKAIKLVVPADWDKFGFSIDADFTRFPLVGEVIEDSPAEKTGLTTLMRIDQMNGQHVQNPAIALAYMKRLPAGSPLELTVRPLTQVPVTLRGWVGPYR